MMNFAIKAAGALALSVSLCAPAAAQTAQAMTPEWFAGTWSDRADCSNAVRFLRDGRFVVSSGGEGRWRIDGNTIILSAGSQERRMPMEKLDHNRARAIESGVISYRCDGPNGTRSN